jgi:hypothetical protein
MGRYQFILDAIWGLRELLDTNPRLMETSLTPIIQACARIVGDEVKPVVIVLSRVLTIALGR